MSFHFWSFFIITWIYSIMIQPRKRIKIYSEENLYKCMKCCKIKLESHLKFSNIVSLSSIRHEVTCTICNDKWQVCQLCKQRFAMSRSRVADNHFMTHKVTQKLIHLSNSKDSCPKNVAPRFLQQTSNYLSSQHLL